MKSLVLEDISSLYPGGGGVREASGIVQAGKVTAVIGPNGSGKSTLLRAIAGLVDFSGTALLEGLDLSRLSRSEMARSVAFVDQNPHMAYPFSVSEVLRMGRLPYGRREPHGLDSMERACKAAGSMDVIGLMDRPVTKLSGGERQRVAIARAFVQDCPVMLLDEPSSALDPGHGARLFSLLRGMAESGKALLITVHDVNLAVAFADRIWAMKEGRIVAQGDPDKVIDEGLLLDLYGIDFYRYKEEGGALRWFFR